jgi:dethiobiotin synthase
MNRAQVLGIPAVTPEGAAAENQGEESDDDGAGAWGRAGWGHECGVMSVLVVTGTGPRVGKTVVVAAMAALARDAGRSVVVTKPAQTGVAPDQPGDLALVTDLSGVTDVREFARFSDAVSPAAAARLSGRPPLDLASCAAPIATLAKSHDLVLVDGTDGLLTRYDEDKTTIASLAAGLTAPLLVVTDVGDGSPNRAALTLEAVRRRGLECVGLVVGSWPHQPDLVARGALADLSRLGVPLLGALPEGAAALSREAFRDLAHAVLVPALGGIFDPASFAAEAAELTSSK